MATSKRKRRDPGESHKKSVELKKGRGRPKKPGKGMTGGKANQMMHLEDARKVNSFKKQLTQWDQVLTNKRGECIPFATLSPGGQRGRRSASAAAAVAPLCPTPPRARDSPGAPANCGNPSAGTTSSWGSR